MTIQKVGSEPMASKRVNEIDLLRFLAAFSVVLFHYSFRGYAADGMSIMPYPWIAPVTKYGHFGVELFFMISGFVILMTAAGGGLQKFVVSRVTRLYPAFWVSCTLTFLAILAAGGHRYSASFVQYAVNLTMMNGFVDVPSIDGIYWSLFKEIQFYFLVMIVLILGKIDRAETLLLLWLVASAILDVFPSGRLRYLLIVDYSPYFIAGATGYLVWARGVSWMRSVMLMAAWVLALRHALGEIPGWEEHYHTIVNGYVVEAIISAFFVVMLLVSTRRTGVVGNMRWTVVGALTYPLYLIHQYIGFLIFNSTYPAVNPHVLLWGTVVIMLGIAHVVHVFVERRYSPVLREWLTRFWESCERRIRSDPT